MLRNWAADQRDAGTGRWLLQSVLGAAADKETVQKRCRDGPKRNGKLSRLKMQIILVFDKS
jgi:hypothetical protein